MYKRQVMNLSAYGSKAEAALEKCVNTITQLEEVFSVNIASSDISNINRNAGQAVHVSEDTMEALRTANKVSLMSDGAFDVTIYPWYPCGAVSYTHLDVYKRQPLWRPTAIRCVGTPGTRPIR